jgi:hypothetical protein
LFVTSTEPAIAVIELTLRIFGLKSTKFESAELTRATIIGPAVTIGLRSAKVESAELTGATIIGPAVTIGLRSAKVKLTELIGLKAAVAIMESRIFASAELGAPARWVITVKMSI